MSFDVFLVAFRDQEKVPADVVAARAVIDRYQYSCTPPGDSYIRIEIDEEQELAMIASGLLNEKEEFDGAMVMLGGMTDENMDFIYMFSKAAQCVLFPASSPPCVIVPSRDLVKHLPLDQLEEFTVVPVENGTELMEALSGGYEEWKIILDKSRMDDRSQNPKEIE